MKRPANQDGQMTRDLKLCRVSFIKAKEEFYTEGRRQIAVGIMHGIFEKLESMLQLYPNNLEVFDLVSMTSLEFGQWHLMCNEVEGAIHLYNKSVQYSKKMLEVDQNNAAGYQWIVMTNRSLMLAYSATKNYEKALECGNDGVMYAKSLIALDAKKQKSHALLASMYAQIAKCYKQTDNLEQAKNYYTLSIDLYEQACNADLDVRERFASNYCAVLSEYAVVITNQHGVAKAVPYLTHPIHKVDSAKSSAWNSRLLSYLLEHKDSLDKTCIMDIESFILSQRVLSFAGLADDDHQFSKVRYITKLMSIATNVYSLNFNCRLQANSVRYLEHEAAKNQWKSCCLMLIDNAPSHNSKILYKSETFKKANPLFNIAPVCKTLLNGMKANTLPAIMYANFFCNESDAYNLLNVISTFRGLKAIDCRFNDRMAEYAEAILGSAAAVPLILCLSYNLGNPVQIPVEVVEIIVKYLTPDVRTMLAESCHHKPITKQV